MAEAVIVSAVRLPTGKFLGTLKDFPAPALGALVVREAVARAGIDPVSVDECIMGNVVSAGVGQAPARQAALKGGLSEHVGALTINKVCGSGLKAVMLASQGIATGDIDIAVAGGMESMSNCPYLLTRVREGLRMGDATIVIENKVDANESPRQCDILFERFEEDPGARFIFLTPSGRRPDTATGDAAEAFAAISYARLRDALAEALSARVVGSTSARHIAEDYLRTLRREFR